MEADNEDMENSLWMKLEQISMQYMIHFEQVT